MHASFKRIDIQIWLCLVTISIFVLIEARYPYFFLQDDNITQNLPYYVHNIRALLDGQFPLYNFHQLLGTPTLSCIQPATLYPFNYLALLASNFLLGHYFGAIECIALFHLLVATLGFYRLMQHFDLSKTSSCFGALAWPFCGFVTTVGSCWIMILGCAAYLPWILYFSLELSRRYDNKRFLVLIVVKVLALFLGMVQFFIYILTFEFFTMILIHLSERNQRDDHHNQSIIKVIAINITSNLCASMVALPLILPALQQTRISASRSQAMPWEEYAHFSYDLTYWLNGLLAPFREMDPASWFEMNFLSHIGYLTLVCIIWALLAARKNNEGRRIAIFFILALCALFWASDIVFTKVFFHLPVYNRLRWPFKLAFFTSFYLIILSSFGMEYFLRQIAFLKQKKMWAFTAIVSTAAIVHISNFIYIHAVMPRHSFSYHTVEIPVKEHLATQLGTGRIMSIGLPPDGKFYDDSSKQLAYNYATLLGLYHFIGYETMISQRNQQVVRTMNSSAVIEVPPDLPLNISELVPLDYLRTWGVNWYIVEQGVVLADIDNLTLFHVDGKRSIYFDRLAAPMVAWDDSRKSSDILWNFRTNTLDIHTGHDVGGNIRLNLLYNPYFSARAGDAALMLRETSDGRILVQIPNGVRNITLEYSDPNFTQGILISGIFTCMLMMGLYLRRNKEPSSE